MGGKPDVRVGRVYDEPEPDDGTRVLVDRIWPRGLTKDKARLDQWFKQVAPSTELRKWYRHDPERFEEFGRRYREELKDAERAQSLEHLREARAAGYEALMLTIDTTVIGLDATNRRFEFDVSKMTVGDKVECKKLAKKAAVNAKRYFSRGSSR